MKSHSVFFLLKRQREGFISNFSFCRRANSLQLQSLELSGNRDLQFFHTSAVNDLDIDGAEERYLVSGGCDGSLAIHDLDNWSTNELNGSRTYKLVCSVSAGNRYAHKRSVETVQWYPLDTGIFTSSGTDRNLKIWDANRLQTAEEYYFNGIVHCHHMSSIATKHNLIAVGTDSSNVKLVDPRAGSSTHVLRGHKEGAVRAVHWSNKDEFILATGGIDNFAMLWDVRSAKGCLMKFHRLGGKKHSSFTRDTTHDGSVNGLCFTADGLHLATVGTDQKLYLWNIWTGKKRNSHFTPLSHIKKRSVKFCLVGCGVENTVFVPTGTCITQCSLSRNSKGTRLYGHYNNVNCCVYHESKHQLFTAGNDHKILVWSYEGDKAYDQFLLNKKDAIVKNTKDEDTHHVSDISNILPCTLDTWSDDDESDNGGLMHV